MHPFVAATTTNADGVAVFDMAWAQGRGVYGGLPAGLMVRAMEALVDDPKATPLRSFTVHFCLPATPGEVTVHARVMRAGRRVTHAQAEVVRGEAVIAFASGSLAAGRPADLAWDRVPMPDALPVENVPSINIAAMGGPRFTRFFEYRFAGGPMLWSGAEEPLVRMWVRPGQTATVVDAALVVGMLDAGPPAALTRTLGPRVVASVDFRVQLFGAMPLDGVDPTGFWLMESRADTVGEGYMEELTHLWAPDGRHVGTCQQLVAILD